MTREELVDQLDDAINDSLEQDWTSKMGAEACVKRLESLGMQRWHISYPDDDGPLDVYP